MRIWIVGLVLVIGGAAVAQPSLPVGSLQRHRFVGASEDGKRIAVLLSHFGPSSQAPFVNLLVKEAGKHQPLWQDNRFLMEGGEDELKYLEGYILKENHTKLVDFGIRSDRLARDVTAQWSTASEKTGAVVTGNLDAKHRTFVPFTMTEEDVLGCTDGLKGKRWKLAVGGMTYEAFRTSDDCYTKEIALRNIVRTKDTYWFVVNRRMPVFNAMNAFVVDIMGSEIKPKK